MPPSGISSPALGFTNELRRARLGVEGTIPGGFEYKLEADFASGDVEVTDALLAYEHGPLKLTVGQHNNFQGLEELSSSNDTSFIERSEGRRVGKECVSTCRSRWSPDQLKQ